MAKNTTKSKSPAPTRPTTPTPRTPRTKPAPKSPTTRAATESRSPKKAERSEQQETRAKALAIEAARSLSDDKCEDVVVLDVRGMSQISDFIVIGSGTSDRQMSSAAAAIRHKAMATGHDVFRSNADERTTWVVLDCVDVVVHVFEPNARAHYDIELLWGDAPRVTWKRRTSSKKAGGGGAEPDAEA